MAERYYFDTSIWLDLLEGRDEPRMPKLKWASRLIGKAIEEEIKIVYSDNVLLELANLGYGRYFIEQIFQQFKPILMFIEATRKQLGRANELAKRRNIPRRDVLHALVAKHAGAKMITFDNHYEKLQDIVDVKNTKQLI